MAELREFNNQVNNAILACTEAAERYQSTNMEIEDPWEQLTALVQEHIDPLLDNEIAWKKNAIELAFKRFLFNIVESDGSSSTKFNKIFTCLDIVMILSEKKFDNWDYFPFALLEDLLDVHTTVECEQLFDYIERRKTELTRNMVPDKGKALSLLRMCNELLRRLSKETNTVFCGRILTFLANAFPLGTRSGVNLRGEFNLEPVQHDSYEDVEADTKLTDEQKEFYKIFWSIRPYFSDPPSIVKDDHFEKFQKGTQAVLEKFQHIATREEEISGSSRVEAPEAKKRKFQIDEMDQDPSVMKEILREINANCRFPRLLSSRYLLDLEMEDVRFRRNVILQFLIVFQYIMEFSSHEKEVTVAYLEKLGKKQPASHAAYTLEDEQEQWLTDMKRNFVDLLKRTKPHGKLYTDIVLTVLKHERNWILWKAVGCPPLEKPPLDAAVLDETQAKRQKMLSKTPLPYQVGNSIWTKIYTNNPESLSDAMLNRLETPEALAIINTALDTLDDADEPVEHQFAIANGALIQASRDVFKSHAEYISSIYEYKKNRYKDVQNGATSERLEAEKHVLQDVKKLLEEENEAEK